MTTMFDIVLNDHSSILSSSLYCLQQDGFMCDIKLQGIDGHVLVHGIVLSVTSLYFKEIIEKSSQDAKNIKLINLETENVSVINLFVELLYTGKVICSEQNVKKIINLIKLYKIENVCYYCKKEKPTANISEDNVNSMSEIESPFGEITDTENMETVEGSDCGFLAHSKESPSGSSDHISDKSGQNNPVKTSADKRNSLPGNVRKTSTRKRKLNPKYFNESSQTLRKADTQNKKQLKNYFNENNESGVSSVSEKSKTANVDISSVEKVMTRNEGQRSNIGYEIDQKEESVSSKNQPANAVKNEPRNNKQQVKQNQSTKTMQQKNIKVEPNKIQDVVISDRNKDTGSKKTMDKEYIQSVSTGLINNAEKDKNENKCPDDVKQESKGKRTRIESQNLLAKLGLIATKENSVAEENTMILECEIGLSDPESENDGDVKKIGRSRNNCLDKPKKCWKCGKMSENYEEYLKHRQEKHPLYVAKLAIKNQKLKGKQRNYCQMCDLNFDCYKSFLQHRKEVKHVRKNHRTVYNCNYCEYTTKVECYLDMHKIKKHNMDLSETDFEIFRCPAKGCDYFNLRKSILEAHVANAHDTEHIEVCEICGKTMKTRKQLQQHVKMHIPVEQRVKKYECPECDKKFTRRTDFTLHFNHKHKNEKPFMCHLCPYRVTSQRLLDIHLYNHHDQPLPSYIKQYTCPVCGYVTIYKHYLEQHLNRHKGVPKYQCHLCEKSFLAKPNLTAHLWRHKTDNKKCPYEGCKYQGKGQSFKEHIRFMHTHKDEKPYRCPLCNYMGKSRGRVRNHLFKFHKMKKVQQEIVYMPDQQTIEINNLEDTEVIQQITHVTANGNIELDTIDLDSKSVDLVMKGLYKQRNDTQVEDSEFDDPPGKLESSDQPTRVIVKDEHTSGENAAQLIVDNDGILTAIQDSKNVIILQHDGLQYGAIEVVDSQI